jgi:hypothetical protein
MVNTKMIAIADKIRSILGITGKMGLDAMAANLETELTNLAAAFASVEAKGGTVPESKISGNLATAIDGIPDGVSVQIKSGTFTTNRTSGEATVNCGFKPDVVYITLNETYQSKPLVGAVDFGSLGKDDAYISLWSSNQTYILWTIKVNRTSNGFSIDSYVYKSDWSSSVQQKTFNYSAVKYT